jgi:tetratricopeptide (TPR) repeat protein
MDITVRRAYNTWALLPVAGTFQSMTEDDYILRLKTLWPRESDASPEAISCADEAVNSFPSSARLWNIRGCIIQLGSENCPHTLEEALRSLRRAVELDPQFADAWEDIGHYYDLVLDDEEAAHEFLDKAQKLRKGFVV